MLEQDDPDVAFARAGFDAGIAKILATNADKVAE